MIFFRPKKLTDYLSFISLGSEEAIKVPGCEVAWADYDVIKRDFRFLTGYGNGEIDQWILENFAYISKHQLELGTLRNSEIPTSDDKVTTYRQANYGTCHAEFQGRGDCMEVRHPHTKEVVGIIDRKGVGVSRTKVLENKKYLAEIEKNGSDPKEIETYTLSNGLMYLGEALIEAANIKITQKAFDVLNARGQYNRPFPSLGPFESAPLQTIDGYFVIRLPFNLHSGPHKSSPAAIYARQAHVGRVWTGKIYTNQINIKQADFFFALCDGGTVRVRLPELAGTVSAVQAGPDLMHYNHGAKLADAVLSGEKNVLEKVISQVLAPLEEELEELKRLKKIPLARQYDSGEEVFADLLNIIQTDPRRFVRFCEVIWYVMKHDSAMAERYCEQIANIVWYFLGLDQSILDIDDSSKPMKRWALLLSAILPSHERKQLLRDAVWDFNSEPEFLARAAILYPFDEIKDFLPSIYQRAGGWLQSEIRSVLVDPRKSLSPLWFDWMNLDAWLKAQSLPAPMARPLKLQRQVKHSNWRRFIPQLGHQAAPALFQNK